MNSEVNVWEKSSDRVLILGELASLAGVGVSVDDRALGRAKMAEGLLQFGEGLGDGVDVGDGEVGAADLQVAALEPRPKIVVTLAKLCALGRGLVDKHHINVFKLRKRPRVVERDL